jgi:hypothetical protein
MLGSLLSGIICLVRLHITPFHSCRHSATASRRLSSASGRSSSRGRSDAPVELQQIRDGLEEELRMLKRQYNEIASHLSQVLLMHAATATSPSNSNHFFDQIYLASGWEQWLAAEQQPFV